MKRWIPFLKTPPRVAVVRLSGVISTSGRGSLNDEGIGPVLDRAFSRGKPDAVALVINSPGGSPVQSALIGARIRRLADEKGLRVYAFVEDVAASGGYWLASSADEIYADASSIVGSIGVISSGFGLSDLIERHGIERRVYTAGKSKSTNDPFKPEKPADVKRLKTLLDQIHEVFKAHVTARRGDKLDSATDLFTGEYWVGAEAAKLGLIDGLGHVTTKMQELYGPKVALIRYDQKRPFWRRFGVNIIDDALSGIEERAWYARFGL